MKPLPPEEISASGLPRSIVRGYDVDATDELLRGVAWNYGWLLKEWEALTRQVAEQTGRRQPDELTRVVLEASRRAAADLRAAARAEGDALLKKARSRAAEIEAEAERAKASLRAEIAGLEGERQQARERLRATLTAALEAVERSLNGAAPERLAEAI